MFVHVHVKRRLPVFRLFRNLRCQWMHSVAFTLTMDISYSCR